MKDKRGFFSITIAYSFLLLFLLLLLGIITMYINRDSIISNIVEEAKTELIESD